MRRTSSAKLSVVAEPAAPLLAEIPEAIAREGRVRGAERLRDMLLSEWATFVTFMPLQALVKLVLETDRHALFAQVAEEKSKGAFHEEKWEQFQKYLHGDVETLPDGDAVPDADDESA